MKKIWKKMWDMPIEAKSAIIYVIANLISRGLAIITVPIFTRLMDVEQIGIVNLYTSWFALVFTFTTMSLTSGGFSLAMKEFERERDQYMSSVLSLTIVFTGIVAIVYFVNIDFWNSILDMPTHIIMLMLVGLLVSPALDFWIARERYEYRYKMSAFITIFSAIVASAISIIAIMWAVRNGYKNTAYVRIFSNFIVIYFIDFILMIYILVKGKTFVNVKYWKLSLQLSIPLVGYSIASQVLNLSDRMMINYFEGAKEVGLYSILYTVSSLSIMIWTSINSSFVPYLFKNIEKKNNNIKTISFKLLYVYSIVAILFTFFAPEIVMILATEEYLEAKYIMPPIAAGVFFISISNLYSNVLIYYKKTKKIMFASIIAAVINVITNYVFIRTCGYKAAAYTTLFAYIISALFQAIWSHKAEKELLGEGHTIYNNKKIFVLSIITMVICMSALIFYDMFLPRYLVAGVVVILAILYWLYDNHLERKL